jgi:uncharacterized protein (TIGR00251 family)
VTSPIQATGGGVRIAFHVQPRAAKTEVRGLHGGAIKLRVAAPPVDGAANEEIVRFLAATFGIPRRAVVITAGGSARRKLVDIAGISVDRARTIIP